MTLPAEMDERISVLEESLTKLEEELDPLLSTPWEQLTGKLEPMEKAKLNLMIAYAADSLFYMFLKTQGAATEEHPVTEELARIKTYMGKLKQLGEGAAKDQQRLKVNKEAAQRFIAAGLGGGGGGDGDEREGKKEKREKPDLEDSGKKKKKKST